MGVLSNRISREELKPGDHIYSWRTAYLYAHHGSISIDTSHNSACLTIVGFSKKPNSIFCWIRIFIGEEKVIHFTRGAGQEIGTGTVLDRIILSSSPSHSSGNPCPRCGDQSRLDGVISSCIDCFLAEGHLYLFQYHISPAIFLAKARGGTCTLAASDPPADAIHRASFLLQNGFGVYHIFRNNCEDFAIYCKTGLLVFTSISVGRSGQAASFLAAASAVVSSPLRFLTTSFSGLAAVGCAMYCASRIVSDIGVRRDVTKVPVERLVAESGRDESVMAKEDSATETDKKETTTEAGKEAPGAETGKEDSATHIEKEVAAVVS